MNQSEQINELALALSRAQGELEGAKKDAANPFFKSHYADLESVWGACRKALAKNGLAVIQTMEYVSIVDGAWVLSLVTTLAHSSGQWMRGYYPIKPVKDDPQSMGSAVTYARRYTLAAIVGVYQTDDDGNVATGLGVPPEAPGSPQTKKPMAIKPQGAPAQRGASRASQGDWTQEVPFFEPRSSG